MRLNEFTEQPVEEGYYDLNDDGMQPIDLSTNPSFKELVTRYTQLVYQGHTSETDPEEDQEHDDIEQYVAQHFGEKGSAHLQKAAEVSYWGRDDKPYGRDSRSSNLGRPNQPGGNFRTTKAGKMHGQDAKIMKAKVADRLGRHPEPNLPESVEQGDLYAMALQRYPHLKQVDQETVITALNNAYEDYLMHYGYEGIGPDEESSMIDHAVKELKPGVTEGSDIDADIENLKYAIRFETPRSVPGEDHRAQYARHAEKIAGYKAELKKLVAQKKQQGVTEGNYDDNRTGFSRGPRDDERHDLDVPRPTIYALKINGKIWQKDGNVVTFFTRERALAARNSILNKRPELEVGLVQRQD